jgi:predicted RNase H-like HicB family nuclease
MKPIYTIVFRQYESEWLALCLENGIVSQGHSRLEAEAKLREAIETVNDVLREEPAVYQASVPVSELHEFLTMGVINPTSERYELQAVYA